MFPLQIQSQEYLKRRREQSKEEEEEKVKKNKEEQSIVGELELLKRLMRLFNICMRSFKSNRVGLFFEKEERIVVRSDDKEK